MLVARLRGCNSIGLSDAKCIPPIEDIDAIVRLAIGCSFLTELKKTIGSHFSASNQSKYLPLYI
jgi:hypothetical protein